MLCAGECIASYDTCTGIPQCADASDEDPALCPAPTTLAPPPHRHLRPDMDPPPQQQFPAQRPQQFWPQQQQQQQQPVMSTCYLTVELLTPRLLLTEH